MGFNPASISKVLVRTPNWLGDAVMSLPAIRSIRGALPKAHIAALARPSVAEFYSRESSIDEVIAYTAQKGLRAKCRFAAELRERAFECAILLQNAFDAAFIAYIGRIPLRIGYRHDGRGPLLTHAIPVPEPGDIPRHERFYYLELLRRAALIERFPPSKEIRLDGIDAARAAGVRRLRGLGIKGPVIGISPGAAYGGAKRWLPERFIETAKQLSSAAVVFGSKSERALCERVASALGAPNLAGETTLGEFIELAAACRLFLTNDSGAMHVAAALCIPTIAVFGATDDTTTGPAGPLARVVREHAECSPCLLRECPIDHRCMTRVSAEKVAGAALQLLEESAPLWTPKAWTQEARS
jgi:heptosyltransferase-2